MFIVTEMVSAVVFLYQRNLMPKSYGKMPQAMSLKSHSGFKSLFTPACGIFLFFKKSYSLPGYLADLRRSPLLIGYNKTMSRLILALASIIALILTDHLLKNILPVTPSALHIPLLISLALVILLIYWLYKEHHSRIIRYSLIFIISGGLSNIIDYAYYDVVRDFLNIGPLQTNLADGYIIAGALLLLGSIFFGTSRKKVKNNLA